MPATTRSARARAAAAAANRPSSASHLLRREAAALALLDALPADLLTLVLTVLSTHDLGRVDQLCHAFHSAPEGAVSLVEEALRRRAAAGGFQLPLEPTDLKGEASMSQFLMWLERRRARAWANLADGGCNYAAFVDLRGGVFELGVHTSCTAQALQGLRVVSVSAGHAHVLAVTEGGGIYSWGSGSWEGPGGCYRLGHGDDDDQPTPKPIESLQAWRVVQAAAGRYHSIALTEDNDVVEWGWDGVRTRRVPTFSNVLGGLHVVHVSAGCCVSLALSRAGRVYTWGNAQVPKLMRTLVEVKIVSVSCKDTHALAVTDEGRVYSWGFGGHGRLGHGDQVGDCTPKMIKALQFEKIVSVTASMSSSFAVTDAGKVYSWGAGSHGKLGHGHEAFNIAYQEFEQMRTDVGLLSDSVFKNDPTDHDKKKFVAMVGDVAAVGATEAPGPFPGAVLGSRFSTRAELYGAVEMWAEDPTQTEFFFGPIALWDVSAVTDMNHLFRGYNLKVMPDISSWDVSNVTNMEFMFGYSNFNGNISDWDVSNVTNMNYMFAHSSFNGDVSDWDVSNVTTAWYIFFNASAFDHDLSSWSPLSRLSQEMVKTMFLYVGMQLSNEQRLRAAFSNSLTPRKFDIFPTDVPLRQFGNSNDLRSAIVEWKNSPRDAESKYGPIGSWGVSAVTDMMGVFAAITFEVSPDISTWDVSNVTSMRSMFFDTNFNGDISSWDVSSVTDMTAMFENNLHFDKVLRKWDVSNVESADHMFHNATSFDQLLMSWNLAKLIAANPGHIQHMFLNSGLSLMNQTALRHTISAISGPLADGMVFAD